MRFLKLIVLCITLCICSLATNAQSNIPYYGINTDVVYGLEKIPMIGLERFFVKNERLHSWHVDAHYQFQWQTAQFGFIFSQGDVVSMGVYQGPGVKVGYTNFTKWEHRKWQNYYSPTLGVKYLWYDRREVNLGGDSWTLNTREQSEKAIALVPQFYIGQKRYFDHVSFDYYLGAQVPVKFRDKYIYSENGPNGTYKRWTPYTTYTVDAAFDIVFGIKLGYIKMRPTAKHEDKDKEVENPEEKEEQ